MKEEKWMKLPPIQNGVIGCACCGDTPDILPLNTQLYQAFGGWMISKNDDIYYMHDEKDDEQSKMLSDIELEAKKDPDNDWRAELVLPLRDAIYQRQDNNKWMLIKKGIGFA